jgi:glycerophosphoryl diester phosphodiesterase
MNWLPAIERGFIAASDAMVELGTRAIPPRDRLERCKVIAHRGVRDSVREENTIPAFARAEAAGVWGIELDLHWTRDGEPVASHDPDLWRQYGCRRRIDGLTAEELRRRWPAIPTLAEVIRRFGGRIHLMIEIKAMPARAPTRARRRLVDILDPLEPGSDYHLLSLTPPEVPRLDPIPPSAFIAVAAGLPRRWNRWVRDNGWGGVCGHYFLVNDTMIRRHHRAGRRVGIGYARSRNSLFRELRRGVDWIFSNHAAAMQDVLDSALGRSPGSKQAPAAPS